MVLYNNLLIVIVTYNPDDSFLLLVAEALKMATKVVIVDNGSSNIELIEKKLPQEKSLLLYKSQRNRGIGWGLNQGIRLGRFEGVKWILTFDQDSFPCENYLDYYNYVINRENKRIGLISANYATNLPDFYGNMKITYHSDLSLITSGMLHNIEVFNEIGFYNEKMFIDYVDFEYVLRANLKGFATYKIENIILSHHLGIPLFRKLGFWTIYSTNHSPIRRYYKARNHIFVTKQYIRNFPCFIIKKNIYFIITIFQILLVDTEKNDKLKMIIRGIKDGLFDRLGSYD